MPEKCSDNCPLASRVDALERDNNKHSKTHEEIFRRLNEVEKDNAVQEEHYKQLMNKLEEAIVEIKALSARLCAMETKPAKRLDSLVDKAVWAVAAAVITFLLAQVGL